MSEVQDVKDCRGVLARDGAAALRKAVENAEPVNPKPFNWNLCEGADGWTKDPDEIANLSDASIIDGLLRNREVGTIIGAAKTLKTWFSLDLALKVASGGLFLGMATHKRKVLYLDYELKEGTFIKRMSMLSPDRPVGFLYQCLRGESRLPGVNEIAALVETEGFGLVVVDSLYRTGWLREENNNDSTSRDLTALQTFTKRVACSVICVDHTAKGGGEGRSAVDAARGASSKGGFYDCLLVLRPTDKGLDPNGNYVILDPEVRDWPKHKQLPLVSFTWSATSCTVELAGEVERGESDAYATKILEALSGAELGLARTAIAAACGMGETTLRRALDALVFKERVIEFPDPKHKQRKLYRVPDMADGPRQTPPNPTP